VSIVFFDVKGVITTEWVIPQRQTVNQYYKSRQHSEIEREESRLDCRETRLLDNLHQHNAPVRNALSVKKFLSICEIKKRTEGNTFRESVEAVKTKTDKGIKGIARKGFTTLYGRSDVLNVNGEYVKGEKY